jgi:methylphosphotriester-DNA--protein-cysteine methyltransferase
MPTAAPPQLLDPRICEQVRLTRDARFDGLFFIAVRSTGIYCRPICPAPTPKAHNVEYYANAAAAAAAGYRPCLRCRPEAAPGTPLRARSALVAAALRLIETGLLDRASVAELAARIGVGERHLRRLFVAEIGAGPLEIAATRRLLFAKKLLGETSLPITQIGLAAGYRSLRRFNTAFRTGYGRSPRALRRTRVGATTGALTLRLPYRAPYDFAALLAFFARRAIPGVETVDADSYSRRFALGGEAGSLRVTQIAGADALAFDDRVSARRAAAGHQRARAPDVRSRRRHRRGQHAPGRRPETARIDPPASGPAPAGRLGRVRNRDPRRARPADQRLLRRARWRSAWWNGSGRRSRRRMARACSFSRRRRRLRRPI